MKTLKNIVARAVFLLLLLLGVNPAFAQRPETIEMADTLRAEGKIYVVVAVLCIILIGILIFLIMLDRKLGRLEKQVRG
ncbi:CcmD family protein [Adhaeribacter soli]|uniref:CcmD family protein n=1 Tax=Adhaeribacter soli TaxID=2607655 RepID=A0A5N1INX5_9BACT|nr:CcmD family protein [Adhaeribacter soli]KAA9331235.1 CcmD family protein [Adhaeribacter soli]